MSQAARREHYSDAADAAGFRDRGVRSVAEDWYVDPAGPARPSAEEPSLEDRADAFLAAADRARSAADPAEGVDLFSSDPEVLRLWQAAADAYGVDEEEGELAWQTDALCAQTDPEAFFPEKGGSTRDAKRVCSECPVSRACLEYALAKDERFGIWGGLSERERRRLRKRVS